MEVATYTDTQVAGYGHMNTWILIQGQWSVLNHIPSPT